MSLTSSWWLPSRRSSQVSRHLQVWCCRWLFSFSWTRLWKLGCSPRDCWALQLQRPQNLASSRSTSGSILGHSVREHTACSCQLGFSQCRALCLGRSPCLRIFGSLCNQSSAIWHCLNWASGRRSQTRWFLLYSWHCAHSLRLLDLWHWNWSQIWDYGLLARWWSQGLRGQESTRQSQSCRQIDRFCFARSDKFPAER